MVCTTISFYILTYKAKAFIFLRCVLCGHQLIYLSCVKIKQFSLHLCTLNIMENEAGKSKNMN